MKKFEVIFLTEAREFFIELDEKVEKKSSSILTKPKSKLIRSYLKSLKTKFGSSELYLIKLITGSLLFGTKKINKKPWFWRRMELLKRQIKYLKKK